MKIRIDLKDPDGVYESIGAAVRASVAGIPGLSDDEREILYETRRDSVDLDRWIECGEYVSIEIDTEAGTARVLERKG